MKCVFQKTWNRSRQRVAKYSVSSFLYYEYQDCRVKNCRTFLIVTKINIGVSTHADFERENEQGSLLESFRATRDSHPKMKSHLFESSAGEPSSHEDLFSSDDNINIPLIKEKIPPWKSIPKPSACYPWYDSGYEPFAICLLVNLKRKKGNTIFNLLMFPSSNWDLFLTITQAILSKSSLHTKKESDYHVFSK